MTFMALCYSTEYFQPMPLRWMALLPPQPLSMMFRPIRMTNMQHTSYNLKTCISFHPTRSANIWWLLMVAIYGPPSVRNENYNTNSVVQLLTVSIFWHGRVIKYQFITNIQIQIWCDASSLTLFFHKNLAENSPNLCVLVHFFFFFFLLSFL